MTTYQALKSLTQEQAAALIDGKIISEIDARDVLVFEYYEDRCKEVSKMDARFDTAQEFGLSVEQTSRIIRKMRGD